MFQSLSESLGAIGGLLWETGSHRARDREELGLDPPADPAGAELELDLEAVDRALEPARGVALTSVAVGGEVDH